METIRELIEGKNPKLNDVRFVVDVVLQVAKTINSDPRIKEVSVDNVYVDGSSVYVGEMPKAQPDVNIESKVQYVRRESPAVNTGGDPLPPPVRKSPVSQTPSVNANQTPKPQVVNTDKVPQKDLQDYKNSGIIKKGRKIVVKSFKTAITVAVSLHKAKPEMYIEIKSDDDYELDLNLVVCTNPTYKGVVIEIGENGEEIFEQYAGKEYSQWREIARIANSRLN